MEPTNLAPTEPIAAEPHAAVADLIGLTARQIRKRFAMTFREVDFVKEARLDGEVLVTVIDHLGVGGCDNQGSASLSDVNSEVWRQPDFVFRDGRLSEVRSTDPRRDQTKVAELILNCRPRTGRVDDDGMLQGYVLMVPLSPFILTAILADSGKPTQRDADTALAALRLGQPPPGGLTAYSGFPPKAVTVTLVGEGDAEILIKAHNSGNEGKASVRNGRVVALVAPYSAACVLESDRAIHCSYAQ